MKAKNALLVALLAVLATSCKKKGDEAASPAAEPQPKTEKASEPAADDSNANDEPAAGDDTAKTSIHSEEVTYTAGDTTLKGYLAYDESIEGPRPGVLVVHEWWGHNDYARMRARMLAEMGYTALAVDMYGDGQQAEHPDDAKKFMMQAMSNIEETEARFAAAKKLLEEHKTTDADKTAAIGYCFGGGVVLHMARTGMDLDAVASFHGSLGTEKPAAKGVIKGRILVLNGGADPMTTAEAVEAFKKEMADAEVPVEFHQYEGAKHAFTNPGATALGAKFKLPLEYNEEADKQSWAELEKFLSATFETGAPE